MSHLKVVNEHANPPCSYCGSGEIKLISDIEVTEIEVEGKIVGRSVWFKVLCQTCNREDWPVKREQDVLRFLLDPQSD